ncbi:MAG: RNA polymerase sigma factor [Anaerolineae bacterium]
MAQGTGPGRALLSRAAGPAGGREGGFYDAEDLWQDLFLEFCAVVRRWQRGQDRREERLWALWRSVLWRGGMRVLRRKPQRLWEGVEEAVEPRVLALDAVARQADPERVSLPREARQALTHDDAWQGGSDPSEEAVLARALWGLRPLQRQMLYLDGVVGLSTSELARCLGLPGPNAVSQRLYRARELLRARLADDDNHTDA